MDVAFRQAGPDLKADIRALIDSLGGLGKFARRGERTFLKPNFNTADPFPASTDLGFLRAVTEIFLEAEPGEIIIGDASTFYLNPRKVMEEKEILSLASGKVKVVCLDEEEWVKKEIAGARYMKKASVPKILGEVDRLILLPCLKTHFVAQYTGALKLSVGFLKPRERMAFHAGHVQEKLAELNLLIKPDLVLMDARKCFITGGPTKGEAREAGLLMASVDRVALDIEGIKVIQGFEGNNICGIDPLEMPQIKKAIELGLSDIYMATALK